MASNLLIGFLLGAGFGAFVYSKALRSSGGNSRNALILAGCSGVAAMVILMTILSMVFKN
jgi:hypothetical protein